MNIALNGEQKSLHDNCTIAELITQLDLTGNRIAVEVNREIIPRTEHESHQLRDGDQVEIVHAIGGGQY